MINKYSIIENKIEKYNENSNFKWIEMIHPNNQEIEEIYTTYNLPKDYITDITDEYELPRTEGLDDDTPNLFILNYPIKMSNTEFSTRAMSIIVLNDTIITVRNDDSQVFHDLKNELLNGERNFYNIESMLIELSWLISKKYVDYVKILKEEIKELEIRLRQSTKTTLLYDMIEIQKSLINLESATEENSPVIENIFELEILQKDSNQSLLKDLQKENRQALVMIRKSNHFLEKLSDLYSNVISNNMNTIMKVLTSASIVMTVPTIIGGLWGMNTANLPLANHPNAFWYLILISFGLSFAIIYLLKKNDYL